MIYNFLQICFFFYLCKAGQWTEKGKYIDFFLGVAVNGPTDTYATVLANGVGSMICKSDNLGTNWTTLIKNDGLMDIGCNTFNDQSAVVASVMGKMTYSEDGGKTWHNSLDVVPGAQSIARSRVESMYGAPQGTGMSVSLDYGQTWSKYKISANNATRYGALPSNDTWYITSGMWPDEDDETTQGNENWIKHKISSKFTLYVNQITKQLKWKVRSINSSAVTTRKTKIETTPGPQLWGEIWKTSNYGKSWQLVFESINEYYFNAIDCCDESTCYAVAEGDSEIGSLLPGSRILKSNTGGENWNIVYFNSNEASSLMGIHCVNDNEAWAGGGLIEKEGFEGYFLHTINGGQTWTNVSTIAPILFMDMSNDNNYGIASGLTKHDEGVIFSYQ